MTDSPRHPGYLDVHQISLRYGVNEDTVRRWLREHRMPSIKIGTMYLVREADLDEMDRQSASQRSERTRTSLAGRPPSAPIAALPVEQPPHSSVCSCPPGTRHVAPTCARLYKPVTLQ